MLECSFFHFDFWIECTSIITYNGYYDIIYIYSTYSCSIIAKVAGFDMLDYIYELYYWEFLNLIDNNPYYYDF